MLLKAFQKIRQACAFPTLSRAVGCLDWVFSNQEILSPLDKRGTQTKPKRSGESRFKDNFGMRRVA